MIGPGPSALRSPARTQKVLSAGESSYAALTHVSRERGWSPGPRRPLTCQRSYRTTEAPRDALLSGLLVRSASPNEDPWDTTRGGRFLLIATMLAGQRAASPVKGASRVCCQGGDGRP